MRKVVLSLLVVFTAFIWACEDGLDDRASLGTAQASVFPKGTVYQFDLLSWDNASGTCEPTIKTEGQSQAFVFYVWQNPIYKGGLSRLKVISVETKYTPVTPGAPALPSKKYHTGIDLYDKDDTEAEKDDTTPYTADNITFPLFDDEEIGQILISYVNINRTPITYIVDYRFTLFELSTGIEDDIYAEGIRVHFADYVADNNCQ
jgi:hypothetical protein